MCTRIILVQNWRILWDVMIPIHYRYMVRRMKVLIKYLLTLWKRMISAHELIIIHRWDRRMFAHNIFVWGGVHPSSIVIFKYVFKIANFCLTSELFHPFLYYKGLWHTVETFQHTIYYEKMRKEKGGVFFQYKIALCFTKSYLCCIEQCYFSSNSHWTLSFGQYCVCKVLL